MALERVERVLIGGEWVRADDGTYDVVDAAISWTRGPLRLTLSGHNLLNESYYGNSDGDTADPGRPRQVLLTTSLLFK